MEDFTKEDMDRVHQKLKEINRPIVYRYNLDELIRVFAEPKRYDESVIELAQERYFNLTIN